MMETEIRFADWQAFCERFTRQHQGWLVTIDVGSMEPDQDAPPVRTRRRLTNNDPLKAVAAVPNPHGAILLVETGGAPTTRVLIGRPVRLRLQQTDEEANAGICIDADDGQTMRLAFRVAARPETADGLGPSEVG